MRKGTRLAWLVAIVAPATASAGQDGPDRSWMKDARAPRSAGGPGVSGLPHAGGRTFRTLDAYLAYLKDYAGPTDRPWYREIRPGVFELQRGNLRDGAPRRVYTREELERRFGFRR